MKIEGRDLQFGKALTCKPKIEPEQIRERKVVLDALFSTEETEKCQTIQAKQRTLEECLEEFYAPYKLMTNKEDVLKAARQSGTLLKYFSDEFQNDKDIVLAAVKQNGTALQYASNELKNDEEVVLEAIKAYESELSYLSRVLKESRSDTSKYQELKDTLSVVEDLRGVHRLDEVEQEIIDAYDYEDLLDECESYADTLEYYKEISYEFTMLEEEGSPLQYASDELKNKYGFSSEKYSNDISIELGEIFPEMKITIFNN